MSLEEIWARKSDSDVINATRQFGRYTAIGQQVIRAEAERRALAIDESLATDGPPQAVKSQVGMKETRDLPPVKDEPLHREGRKRGGLMTIWSMAFLALCVGWGTAINSVTEMAPTSWSDLLLAGTLMGAPIFLATGLSAGLTYAITKNRAKAFSAWTLPLLLAVMALSIGNTEVLRNEAETQSRPLEGDEIKSYVERLQRDIRTPSETTQYIDELLAEYRTNQFAAKARYESTAEDACSSFVSKGRCKRVDVIALVDHRWRDASGQTVLSLLTKQGETISAEFASGTTAADLRDAHSGRKVVVRCESTYVQGHLRLSGCLLIWLAPK